MSKKERKLKSVHIEYYDEYEEQHEKHKGWSMIQVKYSDGHVDTISRNQIEAFKRMYKVIEDLQEVERLRDSLIHLFGSSSPMVSSSPVKKE